MTNELVLSIAVLVGAAMAAALVARVLRTPAFPLYIGAGVALALALGADVAPSEVVRDLLLLSIAFLLFVGGLALNPSRFPRDRIALYAGLALGEVLVIGALGWGLATLAGWGLLPSLYAAFAVALSSTLLVTSLLAAQHRLGHLAGRLATGFLLVQDALAILLLALVPLLASAVGEGVGVTGGVAARTLGGLVAMTLGTWLVMRWVLPRLLGVHLADPEDRGLVALGLVFLSLVLAEALGLPVVLGPFFAGVALSPYPSNLHVRGFTRSIRQFFLPLFFVTLGLFLTPLALRDLPIFVGLLLLVLVAKPALVVLTAALSGFTMRTSVEAGLLIAQGSEFALALALSGLAEGALDSEQFAVLGAVIAVSMAAAPFLPVDRLAGIASRAFPRRARVFERPVPEGGHVVIFGGGGLGLTLAEGLALRGKSVVIVDHDLHVAEAVSAQYPVIRGEGAHPWTLEAARAHQAARVYAVMGKVSENLAVARALQGIPVVVRTTSPETCAEAERLGAEPLHYPHVVGSAFLAAMERAGDVPHPGHAAGGADPEAGERPG